MKKVLFSLVMVLCAVLLLGCTAKGKEIKISLKGNPTTGYAWTYTFDQKGILEEKSNNYIADNTTVNVVGVGGTYNFNFLGKKEGIVILTFQYARSFETVEPLYTIIYKVKVDKDKKISLVSSLGEYSEKNIPVPEIK